MNERKYNLVKHPIYPEEIEQFRKSLQIGQQVMMNIPRIDSDLRMVTVHILCTVAEKYKWVFVVRDQKGRRHCETYINMMIQGG